MTTRITLVVALDRQGAIGRGNALPWHLPDDLRRFKALTLGRAVLMGRRTAESIGRALPGRDNLVLTRNGQAPYAGQRAVASLEAALSQLPPDSELMVIGGGEVYAGALPHAHRIELTEVDTEVEGADTWFPEFDRRRWEETAREPHPADARHAHAFSFVSLRRKGS